MNKAISIIEINGNRYDAASGQLVGAVKRVARHATKSTQGLSIDGFTRRAAKAGVQQAKRSVHELKRRPQHSKTLMRATVKKSAHGKFEDKIKFRGLAPDHGRADRARRVPQSSKVQRFGLTTFSRKTGAETGEVIEPSTSPPIRSSMAASATLPSIMTSASHYKLERLLDYALTHADSHNKSLRKNTRLQRSFFGRFPRWLVISLLIVALVAAAGFVAWRVMPGISFKLAASKAHVNASMPTPISGYKIGPITSTKNTVTTTIESTSDRFKKYTVTQQAYSQPKASLVASAAAKASGNSFQVQKLNENETILISQDKDKSTVTCTNGYNTVSVATTGLNPAQVIEAGKNACKS